MNDQHRQEIEIKGSQFKKEKKELFFRACISFGITIIIEIVFLILLKTNVIEAASNLDQFTLDLIMYIVLAIIIVQIGFVIFFYFHYVYRILKMDDYQAGLYKIELDKKNNKR